MWQDRRTDRQKVISPRSLSFRSLTQRDSCPTLELLSTEISCAHFPPPFPTPFFPLSFPSLSLPFSPSGFYFMLKGTHLQSWGCELEGGSQQLSASCHHVSSEPQG